MKKDIGKRTLEGHKFFPYVAWIVTAGFAFFVYNIVSDLRQVTDDLQRQATELEQRIQNDPQADFDGYNERRLNTGTEPQ